MRLTHALPLAHNIIKLFVFRASCSSHCLAALNLGAGVEQPFDCLIVHNRQAVQSMRRSVDWTLEDNMVDEPMIRSDWTVLVTCFHLNLTKSWLDSKKC